MTDSSQDVLKPLSSVFDGKVMAFVEFDEMHPPKTIDIGGFVFSYTQRHEKCSDASIDNNY